MKAPNITPNFIPSLYQQGFMLEELHRTLPDGTPCVFTQKMNHIITDQEQCAINQKLFEAAPKMAEVLNRIVEDNQVHGILWTDARQALLDAGYQEE